LVGLYLQKRLPEHHMSGESKDMILAVIGLVSLLLALVLGTLVGKTYEFFTTQKSELETWPRGCCWSTRPLRNTAPRRNWRATS
jgi:hypothetical protein